jgi:NAD(P)-dependent dehydrogenase (short-subunit alcohol dehydrogenase family)
MPGPKRGARAPILPRQRRAALLGTLSLAVGLAYAASAKSSVGSAGPAPGVGSATPGAPAAAGPVVLVTGSTDGLGREVARRLAAGGAHVIVHGRNRERGEALVAEIEREGRGSASFYAADLADLAQVRALGEAILRDHDRLDVLVNNAGIWRAGAGGRELSADGHELHFAVNYLAGVLLTRTLLPRLLESAPARIVNVASAAQTPIDFDDVMLERGYTASRAYAQSKLAQVMFTRDLARELEGSGVSVVSLHPATLMPTTMVQESGMAPRSTVDEGADAVVNLVTAPDIESGRYFDGMRPARANAQAYDDAALARLRRLGEELIEAAGR